MTFSEFAQGLSPFISNGLPDADYFTDLMGNFIADAAMDSCSALKKKPDTRARYIAKNNALPATHARYFYQNEDRDKFISWLTLRIDEADSYDHVICWLKEKANIKAPNDAATACADLLEDILIAIAQKHHAPKAESKAKQPNDDDKLVEEIKQKIESLSRPAKLAVPPKVTPEEQVYTTELRYAYSDAEGVKLISPELLEKDYGCYAEDLALRRIDYYAAETIRRALLELGDGSLSSQFEELKGETLSGVRDTALKNYDDGFQRMLSVMEQSVNLDIKSYVLSQSPYWINNEIKKGVCHHLVNDGKIKWVKDKDKKKF